MDQRDPPPAKEGGYFFGAIAETNSDHRAPHEAGQGDHHEHRNRFPRPPSGRQQPDVAGVLGVKRYRQVIPPRYGTGL